MIRLLLRLFVVVFGFGFAVGCTEAPQTESCQYAATCQLASYMAAEMSHDIGTDFGGGVRLSNVQAAGALVVFDLEMPIPGFGLEEVQKRAVHDVAAQSFVLGLCSEPDSEEIFTYGNAYQVRTVGNDGVLMGASTVRSCGG